VTHTRIERAGAGRIDNLAQQLPGTEHVNLRGDLGTVATDWNRNGRASFIDFGNHALSDIDLQKGYDEDADDDQTLSCQCVTQASEWGRDPDFARRCLVG
jgi:hypothetical protein